MGNTFHKSVNQLPSIHIQIIKMSAITSKIVMPTRMSAKASVSRVGAQLWAPALNMRKATMKPKAIRFSVSAAADEETVNTVRSIISEQLGTDIEKVAADAK